MLKKNQEPFSACKPKYREAMLRNVIWKLKPNKMTAINGKLPQSGNHVRYNVYHGETELISI